MSWPCNTDPLPGWLCHRPRWRPRPGERGQGAAQAARAVMAAGRGRRPRAGAGLRGGSAMAGSRRRSRHAHPAHHAHRLRKLVGPDAVVQENDHIQLNSRGHRSGRSVPPWRLRHPRLAQRRGWPPLTRPCGCTEGSFCPALIWTMSSRSASVLAETVASEAWPF